MAIRKYNRQNLKEKKAKKTSFLLLKAIGVIIFLSVFCAFSLFFYYGKDLPRPEKFTEKQLFQPTEIYDKSGQVLLYRIYGEEKRELISYSDIPEHLERAVLSAEDADFYNHFGIDAKGILRAIVTNLKLKESSQWVGGSTITQQLIRSSFLTNEKTVERKIKEIILTLDLERKFSKEQILEFYLNQVPFGKNCYGVQCAAKTYFKKRVSEISLPEAAILAAVIRAPSRLSPYGENINTLLSRKDHILELMVENGYLEREEAQKAKEQDIDFAPLEEINPIKAPHFVLEVKNYLVKKYGEDYLKRQGFKVYTSLDWELQSSAEEIVRKTMEINKNYNAHNSSAVAINPQTGEILAMVGSKDYFSSPFPDGCDPLQNQCLFSPEFNVATLGKRQPGSIFKPFAFFVAFKKGLSPDTLIWDVETNFGTGEEEYIPKNYSESFRGLVSLRDSLAQSINIPSIKVLYLAGGENVLNFVKKIGISTLKKPFSHYGLPLVLGGGEITLSEAVSAYGVFATEGYAISPVMVLKIEGPKGEIVEENQRTAKKIIETQPCRIINDILSDNDARAPMFGENSLLYFKNNRVAAKTGTTQNFNDAWTIGYVPSLAVGVWVGNNNNAPMEEAPGIILAGPIFRQLMDKALKLYPSKDFDKPADTPPLNPIINKNQIHQRSILHYLKRDDPLGEAPLDPFLDCQYAAWEKGVQSWLEE